MEVSSINILEAIQTWCNSLIGTMTILALLAVIGKIIIMAAKESYGEQSFGHRVFRLVVISIYVILAFNMTGSLILRLLSIKWLTTTLLAILYAVGLWNAYHKDKMIIMIVATIICIGGIQGIYQNLPTTITVAGVTILTDIAVAAVLINEYI